MLVNIAEMFGLLFDKNNNVAYKALQELQKGSAIKQANEKCGSCGCDLDPLYKRALELI